MTHRTVVPATALLKGGRQRRLPVERSGRGSSRDLDLSSLPHGLGEEALHRLRLSMEGWARLLEKGKGLTLHLQVVQLTRRPKHL